MNPFLRSSLYITAIGIAASALASCSSTPAPSSLSNTGNLPPTLEKPIPAMGDLVSTYTLASGRKAREESIRKESIEAVLGKQIKPDTEKEWRGAFWGIGVLTVKTPETLAALKRAMTAYVLLGPDTRRAALECVYTVFPEEFTKETMYVLEKDTTPKHVAMAALYLKRAGEAGAKDVPDAATIAEKVRTRFPNWEDNPILFRLNHDLTTDAKEEIAGRPALEELFAAKIRPGFPVLFSLHRQDRTQPGIAVIRRPDGSFVRTQRGAVWNIPHLALSRSDMPSYITNGNTPQGIFTILGNGTTKNVSIGPAPFLESALPNEVEPWKYYHSLPGDTPQKEITLSEYKKLLPESWRGYFPALEAWYSGKAGRSEMLCHGTTLDPEWYAGAPYYPNSPTLGCLSAIELWSPETGRQVRSDQLTLVKEFAAAGRGDGAGYLVVLNLDDQKKPVTVSEVVDAIRAAERKAGIEVPAPDVPANPNMPAETPASGN